MTDKRPPKNIVWLASYPKSGNTWLRVFLANYLLNREKPVPINEVHRIALGDSLLGIYQRVAKGPVDPRDEARVLRLRPAVLRAMASGDADISLVKTHNQNARIGGVSLIPPELTKLALYIVRNPLDMILSYADHYGLSLATAAEAISTKASQIVPDATNVTHYLGNWSDHVSGWSGTRSFPVLTLRYEDIKADPDAAFGKVLQRMGVPLDQERLARAIRFSSFDELRRQEDESGFREKSRHADRFFRSGSVGQWKTELPPEVVETICARHGRVMKRFGYLP
jgi:hypothetical protein